MNPEIVSIGNYSIRWYSVLILIGILLSFYICDKESKKFKLPKDFIFDMGFWVVIIGIIGARLYYVLFDLSLYKGDFLEVFRIWNGGLAIHGAILAGLLTVIEYCKKHKVSVFRTTDIIAPALFIAQAIGRWGNFFNGEAYGSVVEYKTLINMKIIPTFVIDNMFINDAYHLPMFYFESIFCLIGFIIMLILRRRKYAKNGHVFAFYLIWYGVLRFFIEIYRSDSLMIGNLKVAQLVSVIMILIGIYIFIVQYRKPKLDDLYSSKDPEIRF
jgi:phosphatidylglycerol:prolipoprotein diacylglycerol transferase